MHNERSRKAVDVFNAKLEQQREQDAQKAKEEAQAKHGVEQQIVDKNTLFTSVVDDFVAAANTFDEAFREKRGYNTTVRKDNCNMTVGHLNATRLGYIQIIEDNDFHRGNLFQPKTFEIGVARTVPPDAHTKERLVIYAQAGSRSTPIIRNYIDPLDKKPTSDEVYEMVEKALTLISR